MSDFKRRFFFWTERLNITRGERRFVVTAIVLFLITWFADILITPVHTVDPDDYKSIDSLYQHYVERITKRDSLIQRYYYTSPDDSENIASGLPFAIPGDVRISQSKTKTLHTRPDSQSVDVNHADSTALVSLPGIGPIIAKKIIDYRTSHGPFPDMKSLKKVSGIGEKKFAKILPYLTRTSRANIKSQAIPMNRDK